MSQLVRSNFQNHPFHLVSPSPWPFYTSLSLFSLTLSGALSMHSFSNSYNVLFLALLMVVFSMSFWFRDIISEGKIKLIEYGLNFFSRLFFFEKKKLASYPRSAYLKIAKAVPIEDVKETLNIYTSKEEFFNKYNVYKDKNNLGYYLAGLLEGDGSISIPSLGNTTMNRILNPRIVFTTHIDNLGLYAFIQSELGNIGRFQTTGNVLRYIIGDKNGILVFIHLIHGKLRTPKNKRFNDLIQNFNVKYSLNISESHLDFSAFDNNSWLTGFAESDGHFGIKYLESKPKSEDMKRSRSENISLKFRLDQRAYDKPTSSSMLPFMEKLASFLNCNVKMYNSNKTRTEILSLSVSAINNLKPLIDYFYKYPLIGEKYDKYSKWSRVYYMIISKEHLTKEGRLKIRSLIENS